MDGHVHEGRFAVQRLERRAHPRFSIDEDSVLLLAHGVPLKARIIDVSLEGCHIFSFDPFTGKTGRPVEVVCKVNGVAFRLSGVVQWSDGQHMLGIRFVNMIPRRKTELAEVIEEMAAARARGDEPRVAEPVAPEPAPRDIPEIVAEAAAEPVGPNPSGPPVAPPAKTQVAAEIAPPARPPTSGRDRRAQARHEVNTSAIILLVNIGSALRGRILDLSLSGCRIRTDERFPVGIYTRVETEFHIEGLPFRLGGVIQAIHNRNMVGIRFLDLSERKREQVLELIGEIEQSQAALLQAEGGSAEKENPADGS